MKKLFSLIFFIFLLFNIFGENFPIDNVSSADLSSMINNLEVKNGKVVFKLKEEFGKGAEKVIGYKEIHQDGLLFFKLTEKLPEIVYEQKTPSSDTMLVLAGKQISEDNGKTLFFNGEILFFAESAGYENLIWCFVTPSIHFYDHSGRRYSDCSSCLKEKNKEYKVNNLCNCKPGTPWVEGVPGDGIGEGFTIKYPSSKAANNAYPYLLIMNGYISYEKPYLYKQNNRIKKIKVTGVKSGNSKILDVLDTPHPQTVDISFITEPEDIRVEIADVYKGTKYDDTCINFCVTYIDKVIPYEDSIK